MIEYKKMDEKQFISEHSELFIIESPYPKTYFEFDDGYYKQCLAEKDGNEIKITCWKI